MSEQRSKNIAPPALSRNKAAYTRRKQMLALVSAVALLIVGLTVSALPRVAAWASSKTVRAQSPAPARVSSSSRPWIGWQAGRSERRGSAWWSGGAQLLSAAAPPHRRPPRARVRPPPGPRPPALLRARDGPASARLDEPRLRAAPRRRGAAGRRP